MSVRRTVRALIPALLVALALPADAAAHLRMGTVAVGYEATIAASRAHAPYTVAVYASDLALHLTVEPGHTVIVRGYLGERFIRLGPAGLAVDTSSPTAAAAGLLPKDGQHRRWRLEPGVRSVTWHDARVRSLVPGAHAARWQISILVDGRAATIAGYTRRLSRPVLWPWLGLAALLAATALGAWRTERLAQAARALGALAAFAAIALAAGFAFDAYASPGTWIEAADETIFAAAGAAALAWAPPLGGVAAGGGIGLLSLAVGLSKGAVFLEQDVLSVFPGDVARALAAVAIGAGLAASLAGGLGLFGRTAPLQTLDTPLRR